MRKMSQGIFTNIFKKSSKIKSNLTNFYTWIRIRIEQLKLMRIWIGTLISFFFYSLCNPAEYCTVPCIYNLLGEGPVLLFVTSFEMCIGGF
jgi:hypothetical protein